MSMGEASSSFGSESLDQGSSASWVVEPDTYSVKGMKPEYHGSEAGWYQRAYWLHRSLEPQGFETIKYQSVVRVLHLGSLNWVLMPAVSNDLPERRVG